MSQLGYAGPMGYGGRQVGLVGAVLLAVFAVPLSVSGAAVGLPAIAASFGDSAPGQQWALNGFAYAFAASTLAWGAAADRIGRWVCFQLGVLVFIAGSVASALAGGYLLLDAARLFAGLGAGAVFSTGSAALSVAMTGRARSRAFALLGAVAGLSLAVGPAVCGFVTQVVSWRGVFALQAVLLVAASLAMLTGRGPWVARRARVPFDRAAASALAQNPGFLGAALVVAVASFTFAAVVTYLPVFAQAALGLAPAGAGAFVMLLTVPTLVAPLLAGALVGRGVPVQRVLLLASAGMVAGSVLAAAGAVASLWVLAPALVLLGVGFGLHAGLADNAGLSAAPDDHAALAAGWINTVRVGTEAIAVSVFGSLFVPALVGGAPAPAFAAAALVCAAVALVLAIAAGRALGRRAGGPDIVVHNE